jgi:hypothetical protein
VNVAQQPRGMSMKTLFDYEQTNVKPRPVLVEQKKERLVPNCFMEGCTNHGCIRGDLDAY